MMEHPEETPQHQNPCCRSEAPQPSQKARSVGVGLHVAVEFLMEGFLSEIAVAWNQWAWGMTAPVYKYAKY